MQLHRPFPHRHYEDVLSNAVKDRHHTRADETQIGDAMTTQPMKHRLEPMKHRLVLGLYIDYITYADMLSQNVSGWIL